MNNYPDTRYPNSISYNAGGLNVSQSQTLSSGPIRFRRSNVLTGHTITFRYSDLTQTEISEFRQHYLDAAGTHSKFKIPTTVFGGANVTQSTSFYRYASTPNENQKGVFHDIEIEVVVLTGVNLTYDLTSGGGADDTPTTVNDSFFANGTAPFYLFCKDAAGHPSSDLEYLLKGGNAKGV
tara:strand:+ start:1704 stop:2243 length:540 start_codon:yes stop_codon:yes gene_type:complete